MAKQYRAAVIGLGRMGSTFDDEKSAWDRAPRPHAHTPCYRAAGVEVVAGADPHEGQREAYRRKWGIESLYADYREMLEREEPDILSICTTAKPRARILLDAVEVGAPRGLKAIWAEKPIAISLAEADEMVAACQRAGIALAIGCSRAWSPMYNRMRELIDEGELGDLLQVIGFGQAGVSHNGSHLLTTVNRLARGRVQWVFGHMESDEAAAGDVDLQGNGYLHYDNGVQGFVRMTACGGANWEIEVIGTQGVLRAIADAQQVQFYKTVESSLEGRRAEPAQHIFPLPAASHSSNTRTVLDLITCIETGKEPNCSGDDGRHALEVAIAMRESHRRGGTRVALPLADRSLYIRSSESLHGDEPAIVRRARAAAQTVG
ncbi:MAG: Gfo/Idh/MocA family oxidoreductase [Chloroflexota bacterium]|nr:Gfo/Idh/MocA family oxidoreductase [Chloroflexota bacterium]